MIAKEKANTFREKMEAASFGAWQVMGTTGYKKRWETHRKAMGVDPVKSDKILAEEKKETVDIAMSIHERVLRLQKNGK